MTTVTIVDIGSTHNGKKEYAKEMIDRCSDYGVDIVKCQLFNESFAKNGNIIFPRPWFREMVQYAKNKNIGFTASVFDEDALNIVSGEALPFIKFAHSLNQNPMIDTALKMGHRVMSTYDLMDVHKSLQGVIKLYTITHEGKTLYPVPFKPEFQGIFNRFDGFSSHCIGIKHELEAAFHGAKYLEMHMTLGHPDIKCPDAYFAKSPKEIQAICEELKK